MDGQDEGVGVDQIMCLSASGFRGFEDGQDEGVGVDQIF
jgi:hypothetical protein